MTSEEIGLFCDEIREQYEDAARNEWTAAEYEHARDTFVREELRRLGFVRLTDAEITAMLALSEAFIKAAKGAPS